KHRSVKQLTTRSTEVVDVDVEELKLVHAAASLARTGIGGLSSRFRMFVRMVIGSLFQRSGPSAGVAAGLGVHTHGWSRSRLWLPSPGALHGVLARVRDLGAALISVTTG